MIEIGNLQFINVISKVKYTESLLKAKKIMSILKSIKKAKLLNTSCKQSWCYFVKTMQAIRLKWNQN